MNKTIIAAAAAAGALLAIPAVASAEPSFYINAGYSNFNVDADDIDVNLGAITGRVGAKFNPYFGVEGEASFGVADDSIDILGADVDVKLNSEWAAYLVVSYPVSERFDLFARVGYAAYEVEASGGGITATEDGSDAAWGIGGQAFFTDNDGVRLDWTQHGDADAWSLSYVRRF